MSIRVGNQSAFSSTELMAPFEYAVAQAFDAFEWFPDKKGNGQGWAAGDLGPDDRRKVKQTAADHDIRLSVHAPWQFNPLDPASGARLGEAVALARHVGAALLNIHLVPDQGIPAFAEAVVRYVHLVKDAGMVLTIENTPETPPSHFNELFHFLTKNHAAPSRAVGMCLDLGHANLCESTRNDYLRFIDELAPHVPVIHVHMHENFGDYDSHLPLFTGPAWQDVSGIRGFVLRMKKRGFSGSIILEQWPDPPALLNQARRGLLALWKDGEET